MTSTTQPNGNVFTRFMASSGGRVARVAFGTAIIGTGLWVVGGGVGLVVAALGLVPIAAGFLNLCPVAPIWGGHFNGAAYCPSQHPRSRSDSTRGGTP